ncbi:MAG: TetR/AcrR family transcriptional regulator, partial [Rhodoferax sp.]
MQLSRTQWLDQGLLTLADKGPQYVKIDVLCQELGVTKGSFYHHFNHHADFVSALLDPWESTHTRQLIEAVASATSASERAERLSQLVYSKDMRPEVAMRAWGKSHPEVAARVNAVDTQRLQYLTELAVSMGANEKQAKLLARMGYAQLVGIQHLSAHITADEAVEMDQALHAMVYAQLQGQS